MSTNVDAQDLVEALGRARVRLAVAESCTGGMLGAAVTDVPGSSAVFAGGIIAYDDEVKRRLLHVSTAQLRNGAVSGAVVEAMAHGVREALGADMGVAVSGVAGPRGGTAAKPVGTVWIGVAGPGDLIEAHKIHLDGDRGTIRAKAVAAAIEHAMAALDEAEREDLV